MKINHIREPLGFMLDEFPVLGYKVKDTIGKCQKSVNIKVFETSGKALVYDGTISEAAAVYPLCFEMKPRTRYSVNITVETDANETAAGETWFETGKMNEPWHGSWITSDITEDHSAPVVGKEIVIEKEVKQARLYASAAGIYVAKINGVKVGDEFLTPYCNDYDTWQQVITADVTGLLKRGVNVMEATLANGWYKGDFTFYHKENIYGNTLAFIGELYIAYTDGSEEVLFTSDSWYSRRSIYKSAEIYHGIEFDCMRDCSEKFGVKILDLEKAKLIDRLSLPVVVKHTLPIVNIITTPKGEKVLDMGQNMVGLLKIDTRVFNEKDFTIRFFEVLDPEGNVYIENLRGARQALDYKTDGKVRTITPEFTFYGFRYAWIEGLDDIPAQAFTGLVIYSDIDQTGKIETSAPLVNRLFYNALWGQRGNFVDVPTDCPQRDERLGWTGDAQVFCGTAMFNTDAAAFYAKYMYDMLAEQRKTGGAVPHFIPNCGMPIRIDGSAEAGAGAAAWADAAVIIPWTVYMHTGDRYLLEKQYPSMKMWIEHIRTRDDGGFLWIKDFQLGDWLALDTAHPESPFGGTPTEMVASAYYLYSATLVSMAAEVLGKADDVKVYAALAENIRAAMRKEFVTPNGRVASDTQTADVIALFMGFASDKAKTAASLNKKITANGDKLNTGFVGTAYLSRVLSENGHNDLAYKLLLNEDYPGWLYEVKNDATTIWERWNSVKPDGGLGDADMNSFNHYAYGAVMEWVYRNVAGIQPAAAAFSRIRFAPQPDEGLEWVNAEYDSAQGVYKSGWKIDGDYRELHLTIPLGGTAECYLPDAPKTVKINSVAADYIAGMILDAGSYTIFYKIGA
jgi:alpha-L-rhamnosidase